LTPRAARVSLKKTLVTLAAPFRVSSKYSLPMPSGPSAPMASSLPGIHLQGGFRFRDGQRAFLEKLAAAWERGATNHLGVFVPGYGKTITALAAFVMAHATGAAEKLVVFVPRGNLRDQYADPEELAQTFAYLGAPPFSFCVADSDEVFLKNLDTQIVITTYQYASGANGQRALRQFCEQAQSLFVFDEVHHLAEDGTWAESISTIPYARSIGLSGTPLRTDGKALFGVPSAEDEHGNQYYEALHEVTMGDAHAEGGILKRVDAHVVDYDLQMIREDTGEEVSLSLSQLREIADENHDLDAYFARKRLRFHDVYLDALLTPAFERFAQKRRALSKAKARDGQYDFRNHQMVVIAMTNRHAAAMLGYIQEHFLDFITTRIGQDVPAKERARRLDAYRRGESDVMVQVDMIGEGTDIKPISVIVKADLVRARSKTMQQVFRGMRYVSGWGTEANRCDLYASDDAEVVHTLNWIVSEEQIGLKKKQEEPPTLNPDKQETEKSERSPWHLKGVAGRQVKSHRHERFDRRRNGRAGADRRQPQVTDVNAREKKLRQECADLANELAYTLQADGQGTSVRRVHSAAKKRFSKAQDELSVGELIRKRRWLKKCLRARRLV
jgi:superfamily II DNA or RNA helicase